MQSLVYRDLPMRLSIKGALRSFGEEIQTQTFKIYEKYKLRKGYL